MSFFEKIVHALSVEMPRQQAPFMPFHFIMLALIIATTVIVCVKLKDCSEKTFKRTLLIFWIILLGFEIYKQIVSPFSVVDGKAVWQYNLNDIPYQFCSSIHYVLPPIIFLKDGKVKDAFLSFTMTFVFLAGLAVCIFPDQLKSDAAIGICVQTMVHHGLQVVIGVFVALRMYKKYSFKFFLSGAVVFLAFLVVAIILNLILSPANIGEGNVINFFYISPYYGCSLPILSMLREMLPWGLFFVIYFVGFVGAAALIMYIYYLLTKKKRKNQ